MKTHTYVFQGKYGSPRVDASNPTIKSAKLAKDGKIVRLVVEGMQRGHVTNSSRPDFGQRTKTIPCFTIWLTTRFGTFRSPSFQTGLIHCLHLRGLPYKTFKSRTTLQTFSS